MKSDFQKGMPMYSWPNRPIMMQCPYGMPPYSASLCMIPIQYPALPSMAALYMVPGPYPMSGQYAGIPGAAVPRSPEVQTFEENKEKNEKSGDSTFNKDTSSGGLNPDMGQYRVFPPLLLPLLFAPLLFPPAPPPPQFYYYDYYNYYYAR